MISLVYAIGAVWTFAVGAVVGSFANVCIYRIPWQKSVIWPASHCPNCLSAIAPRDNVPILGWLFLGGRCRDCRKPIAVRYPLIEALVGLLFAGVFLVDVGHHDLGMLGMASFGRWAFHACFVALLVIATFIDYDLYIIPDAVTVTGMVLALTFGTLAPWVRPEPATAPSPWDGFIVGLLGLVIGGGIIWAIRILGTLAFRREAMGFGDVTLMAMIGAFLGWQATPPVLFLGAIIGLVHALLKAVLALQKWLMGRKLSGADHEIPFGPYLSMAALILLLGWPWIWARGLRDYYQSLTVVFWFLLGRDGP